MKKTAINKSIRTESIIYLLMLLISVRFFRLKIMPESFYYWSKYYLTLGIIIGGLYYFIVGIISNRYDSTNIIGVKALILKRKIKEWYFVVYFILIIIISMVNAWIFNEQGFLNSYRAGNSWFDYLFIFILINKKTNFEALYRALAYFFFIRLFLILYAIGIGEQIFEMHVSDSDLEGARGIMRLNAPGKIIVYLWGFWSLGKYLQSHKTLHLLFFILTIINSMIDVSRQHIFMYILLSGLFILKAAPIYRRIIFIFVIIGSYYIIPHVDTINRLVELTEQQRENTSGFKTDIRIEATDYYVYKYEQPLVTKILGNGVPDQEGSYGTKILKAQLRGYHLSDLGFIGIYIYFGIVGLSFFVYMFFWVYKKRGGKECQSIKYYIYFLYSVNIFSTSFSGNGIIISFALYYLYCNQNNILKLRQNKVIHIIGNR